MPRTGYFIAASVFLLFLICILPASRLTANPFSSGDAKSKVASPPVYSGGSNTFIKMQFEYRDKVASALRSIKKGESGNMLLIFLTASFLYGLFHAAGPGHRKTIVFSLFISHKVRWYEPGCAGFLSAGIHAGSSIAVIVVLYLIQKTVVSLSGSEDIYAYMEGITFIAIALLSLALIIFKIKGLIEKRGISAEPQPKRLYPLIIVSSLVPCPGATMLLLLSLYAGMPCKGVAGVMAMSAGMGIVISLAGYLAYAGRVGLFLKFKKNEKSLNIISSILELFSFLIILLFSLLMAWPFIRSMLR